MLCHENKRLFVCKFKDCGKRFNQSQLLKNHQFHHNNQMGIKPFACEWPGCEARFASSTYLNK